ncbi:MAG: class I mannose-6-phosphate isomerase [Phycisphaerales bacterium]|nr:class I mannose-6-phosphate isomerase [Phycisphaerales bacterium]
MYPLLFEPILKPKVWGGERLRRFGRRCDGPTGESWEIADLDSTSPSGGGGDAAHSIVSNGEHRGTSIVDLRAEICDGGPFPLLVKYPDAREHLSVQVHPSPEYAALHPEAHLKTESWYVVDAQPGSVIYKGVKPGVTPDEFARRIREGTITEALVAVSARVGDLHDLPSGTCHALGAGVLVAEVQTPSDTTFRVYDWAREYGRQGRDLHIEQAMRCLDFGEPPPVASGEGRLVANEHYTIDVLRLSCESVAIGPAPGFVAVMAIEGLGAIASRSNAWPEVTLQPGTTALLPPSIVDDADLRMGPSSVALRLAQP